MEATMRKFFLIAAIFLSATAAHAGATLTLARADDVQPAAPSSAQLPDTSVLAEKRQAMIQQKMTMQKQKLMAMQKQKQMAIQREMQLHPIRTRFHFALLKFKKKLHHAF